MSGINVEIFRYSRDAYGQQVLEGINFDLLWVFAGLSAAVIAGHLVYRLVRGNASRSGA